MLSLRIGVTGQLVSRELSKQNDIRWAVAGRNKEKIMARLREIGITAKTPSGKDVDDSTVPIIMADSTDQESLASMCKQTKVVITLVGPYSRYGEGLVKACVEHGTHYCDLTVRVNGAYIIIIIVARLTQNGHTGRNSFRCQND